jgi:hypothetical protein
VTKNILSEAEARELFRMYVPVIFTLLCLTMLDSFYHGCSTFLYVTLRQVSNLANCSFSPVFDSNSDTFDALHDRSPFAVDCICMVAARVRDGGGVFNFQITIRYLIVFQGSRAIPISRLLRRFKPFPAQPSFLL